MAYVLGYASRGVPRAPLVVVAGVVLVGILACPLHAAATDAFELVSDGESQAAIVLPVEPDVTLSFAAEELQAYLHAISGAALPIAWGALPSQPCVRLERRDTPIGAFDGYRIEVDRNGIIIASGESRGVLYGVYALLEELGCSFVYPGDTEEIVPHRSTVSFPLGIRNVQPSIEHRGLALYGLQASSVETGRNVIDWMAKNRLNLVLVSEDRPSDSLGPANGCHWREVADRLLPELQRRDFVVDMSEHSTHLFFPRSLYRDHPEWFALRNGKREPGQICYANEAGMEYYGNAQAAYAAQHPEIDILGTWPLDGGNHCQCEPCSNPETIVKAVSKVAEKIRAVRPDLIVEHLAYTPENSVAPTSFKVSGNLSVLYCTGGEGWEPAVESWRQALAHAQGVYQFEDKMGDNYHSLTNTWLRPHYGAEVARRATKAGFRGVISLYLPIENWWRSSFNVSFFARACWEPDLDAEARLQSYYRDYYGTHADTARAIFDLIFNELQNDRLKTCHVAYGGRNEAPVDPEGLAQATRGVDSILTLLDALPRAGLEPAVATRFERLRTYAEYFRLFYEVHSEKKWSNLMRLKEFSTVRPERHNDVILYPDYIFWRLKYDYLNDLQ